MQDYGCEIAEFLYYTPGKWDKEARFWPVRAGESTTKPNYRVGPKRIECYSMHFVRKGALVLEQGGVRYEIEAGDAFCLFPTRSYTYYRPSHCNALELCWLAIDGPSAALMLERAGLTIGKPYVK